MHGVPVAARYYGHFAVQKIFVQLVEGCRCAHASCRHHRRTNFEPFGKLRRKKQPVQKRNKRSVGSGVIYGRPYNQSVSGFKPLDSLVDDVVVENTAADFPAFVAPDAAANILVADVQNFGFNAVVFEFGFYGSKRGKSAALGVRAAID